MSEPEMHKLDNPFDSEFPDTPAYNDSPTVDQMETTSGGHAPRLAVPNTEQRPLESADDPDEADDREVIREMAEQYRQARACQRFLERHANDGITEVGKQLIGDYLQSHSMKINELNLERAYAELSGTVPVSLDQAPPQQQQQAHQPPKKAIQTGLPSTLGESGPRGDDSLTDTAIALQKLPLEQARMKMHQLMQLQAAKNRR